MFLPTRGGGGLKNAGVCEVPFWQSFNFWNIVSLHHVFVVVHYIRCSIIDINKFANIPAPKFE